MSTDVAYPVFRSPDRNRALRVAWQMVAFGRQSCSYVSVDATVPTRAEVKRLREALPDSCFIYWQGGVDAVPPADIPDLFCGVPARDPVDSPGLDEYLPLSVSMLDQPVGSIEDHFAHVVGPYPAKIHWDSMYWPGAPERGLHGEVNNSKVTLLLHCADRGLDVQFDTHTVLVHVRQRNGDGYEDRFAQWLAEQIGQKVIGPPQHP
ncbi:hypothetical protein ACFYYM_40015 [Streptomyces erythrochromogenes]|uniref:hypothetical protein n=1 Tax=Streptomyces erythrochromogenes TaxID=285574 RepID=UPI00369E288D